MNYSIIIPHKNSPKLLQRLLLSIPCRDDIQIIVVDDNSNSAIVDFNNLPTAGHKNISYFLLKDEEAQGAGKARNVGIDNAVGKWLIFADADDTFVLDNFNYVLDKYKESDSEIIFFNANCLSEETNFPLKNLDQQYRLFIDSDKIDDCRYRLRVPWGKMIKCNLVKNYNIRFDETPVANDVMFSLKVGSVASRVQIDKLSIYNWMVNNNSITSNKSKEAVMTHLYVSVRRNDFLCRKGLNKYRGSLFNFIPSLHRVGISWYKSFHTILKYTPPKYIVTDILSSLKQKIKIF